MTCLVCTHGALRDPNDESRDRMVRGMAKLGWVNCIQSHLRAKFHPRHHTCPKFAQADEKTAEARRRWAAGQGQR